ncbi:DUF433 domain-containing protein [Methylosinus sp. 3S-1]|uniref:Putative antitoxin VapB45-like DNA-binding HTH domain-containing protein n=1 Tax=Methylosinus trichosporium (strain ATCC 35070 / NCIMB 11131 / UNIQEM 75 / OB3b) TaxID=595536 RepID=A0A2D2CWY0_METT3|nr:hypothetical protein CQW49_04425 [Methylosinus trichosporium OB3b]OBS50561.1 hypothetical protein A8B73_20910 [Methylosinus sp. 3S-1]
MRSNLRPADEIPIGIGFYTIPEASRLIKTPARSIRRWLGGYSYKNDREVTEVPPLWTPQLPRFEDRLEIGFRDLIELRFVRAFLDAGLGLKTIRDCLALARDCAKDDRPFSTRRFQTDGRTIFMESLELSGEGELLDLKKRQYAFKRVVERTFRDLDVSDEVVTRWRPFNGKESIVVDPGRAFGQPIAAEFGVPTVALAEAVEAEGSVERVAMIYDVSIGAVRDSVKFEASLRAA